MWNFHQMVNSLPLGLGGTESVMMPVWMNIPQFQMKWAVTRPWAAPSSLSFVIAGIRNKRGAGSGTQPYETFLKRSIQYVSLCLC